MKTGHILVFFLGSFIKGEKLTVLLVTMAICAIDIMKMIQEILNIHKRIGALRIEDNMD